MLNPNQISNDIFYTDDKVRYLFQTYLLINNNYPIT